MMVMEWRLDGLERWLDGLDGLEGRLVRVNGGTDSNWRNGLVVGHYDIEDTHIPMHANHLGPFQSHSVVE